MEFEESLLIHRADTITLNTEEEDIQTMTFHCPQCNTVLGDSLDVCGEIECMDSIVCLKVTNDVVISNVMESGHKGEIADCIYSSLKCRGCRCSVGKVIHSAPSCLDAVRSLFLLHKANISCYILNCSSMVKGSTLTFDLKPLTESLDMVRQQVEEQLDQLLCSRSRLADRSVDSQFF